jgi:hypothetical protein
MLSNAETSTKLWLHVVLCLDVHLLAVHVVTLSICHTMGLYSVELLPMGIVEHVERRGRILM